MINHRKLITKESIGTQEQSTSPIIIIDDNFELSISKETGERDIVQKFVG